MIPDREQHKPSPAEVILNMDLSRFPSDAKRFAAVIAADERIEDWTRRDFLKAYLRKTGLNNAKGSHLFGEPQDIFDASINGLSPEDKSLFTEIHTAFKEAEEKRARALTQLEASKPADQPVHRDLRFSPRPRPDTIPSPKPPKITPTKKTNFPDSKRVLVVDIAEKILAAGKPLLIADVALKADVSRQYAGQILRIGNYPTQKIKQPGRPSLPSNKYKSALNHDEAVVFEHKTS